MKTTFALALITAGLVSAQQSSDSLHVLCSNGVAEVMKDLQPQIEKSIGRKINFEFGTSAGYKQRIDKGDAFDVAILTPVMIEDLIKQGKTTAASRFDIARAGVGIGIREGSAKAKVGTAEEFKTAMLKAKSVTLTGVGQSRAVVDAAFEKLGIAAAMKDKMLLVGPGEGPPTVAAGKAEYVLTLISEIIPVKGVQLIGPLPGELQRYTTFTTGASASSKNAAAAAAFVESVKKANLTALLKKHGMEPVK